MASACSAGASSSFARSSAFGSRTMPRRMGSATVRPLGDDPDLDQTGAGHDVVGAAPLALDFDASLGRGVAVSVVAFWHRVTEGVAEDRHFYGRLFVCGRM